MWFAVVWRTFGHSEEESMGIGVSSRPTMTRSYDDHQIKGAIKSESKSQTVKYAEKWSWEGSVKRLVVRGLKKHGDWKNTIFYWLAFWGKREAGSLTIWLLLSKFKHFRPNLETWHPSFRLFFVAVRKSWKLVNKKTHNQRKKTLPRQVRASSFLPVPECQP